MVGTEVEALQLEYNWIKEFDPRFNVRYRDDKSYPALAVTLNEEYPRLQVMRGAKRKGVRYFGPYAHAWAIRETLDLLLRVFPARTCSGGVFKRAGQIGRPCLLGYIGKCSRAVRRPGERRRAPRDRRRLLRVPGRPDGPARAGLERRMARPRETWSSSGRPGCATTSGRCAGPWRSRPSSSATARTPTSSPSPQDDWRPRCRSSTCAAAGCAASAAGWSTRWSRPRRPRLVERFLTQFYGEQAASRSRRTTRASPCRARSSCPSCPPDADALAEWLCRLRGSRV